MRSARGPGFTTGPLPEWKCIVPTVCEGKGSTLRQLESMPESIKTVTLWCEAGKHLWDRPSQKGRRPTDCPNCSAKAREEAQAKKASEPSQDPSDRLVHARAKKAEKREEAARQAREEEQRRRDSLQRRLPNLMLMWNRAFTVALVENTDGAWLKAENLMTNYVNAKRQLEAPLPELTSTEPKREIASSEPESYGLVEMVTDYD